MSERTSYTAGTPSWVDLATPDIEAGASFYAGLFGWEVPERPNSAEIGGYRRAELDGADVAGMMPLMQEGQPSAWTTYIAVDDADATAAAVKENGGSVLAEPMDVMDLGRMAVFMDSTGAAFGIWQAGTFAGAARVNEPGAFTWNELATRDVGASKQFYTAVFGWDYEDHDMGEMGTYTEFKVGGDPVGGLMDVTGRLPDEVPAHWMTYFAVDDTDAALERVKAGGGSVSFGPIDIPAGRFAIVTDPAGAAFSVIKSANGATA
jgi:predicted enzyme related to lactoylglutathione lyase